ncbi:MAG: DUF1697 domain-containing protein [Gemmatimonadaceae bacterium]|nr:DUF1697 domain-containing protein [Gemmatimonadaceae bacterium]MCW5825650.1 DUF1697 domain-containing protein [Gemmatimonadaceae bacterium]
MPTHIALLRAINVGGTGKLPMADLRALCEDLGFQNVRTYIQSGNVVFDSRKAAPAAQRVLADALAARIGKPVGVLMRSEADLTAVLRENPFPEADPRQLLVLFLPTKADEAAVRTTKPPGSERLVARGREIFIHFPHGMGTSKLRIPFADVGTGRNLNTVTALLDLART